MLRALPMLMHARLLILGAALLWSTGGAVLKLISLGAWQVTCGRSLIAAFVLAAAIPSARRVPARRAFGAALAGAATMVLFVQSTKLTTAANAIFLQSTAPLYVLVLSPWLLGERPSRGEKLAIPIFLLGLGLFFLDQLTAGQLLGNVLALVSGFTFALSVMGLRAAQEETPAVLLWSNLLAGLGTVPLALSSSIQPGALDVGLLVFLGTVQIGLSYALFGRGLRHTPAVEASLLVLVEPVLNPVWALLLVGERPGAWSVVGGGIILCATAWRILVAARAPGARAAGALPPA
jgi:drug/metabolite transporter (DMT)-like permease